MASITISISLPGCVRSAVAPITRWGACFHNRKPFFSLRILFFNDANWEIHPQCKCCSRNRLAFFFLFLPPFWDLSPFEGGPLRRGLHYWVMMWEAYSTTDRFGIAKISTIINRSVSRIRFGLDFVELCFKFTSKKARLYLFWHQLIFFIYF